MIFFPMFFLSVPLKRTRLIAREAALTTSIGLFSSVLAFVPLQLTAMIGGIVALVTLKQFFP